MLFPSPQPRDADRPGAGAVPRGHLDQLRDSTARLQAAEESRSAAQDVLNRAIIKAPVGGEVLNLSSNTKGGVVAPGDTVLEIVPNGDSIVASVQIKPTDRAQVFEGLNVRTQASAYRSWKSPSFDGTIQDVSADLKRDPAAWQEWAKWFGEWISSPLSKRNFFTSSRSSLSAQDFRERFAEPFNIGDFAHRNPRPFIIVHVLASNGNFTVRHCFLNGVRLFARLEVNEVCL